MEKKYFFIISILLLVILGYMIHYYSNLPSTIDYKTLKQKKIQNLNNQKSKLIGSKINSLKKICNDSIGSHQDIIIFYYEGTDCQDCVKKCFAEIKKISNEKINLKVIASNTKISSDQLRYDYFKQIYDDKNGLIKRELLFLYSPAFIYLKNDKIEAVEFILSNNKFDINSLFQNQKKKIHL